MAKTVNANSINDMTLMNMKSQARMAQLLQKIGKGKRRVKVTLSKSSRAYLSQLANAMKNNLVGYEKQSANVFHFIDYLNKEVEITKENKKEKFKDLLLSFEEYDYLKLQIKEALKGIEEMKKTLKWYNFKRKMEIKVSKKYGEILVEEFEKNTIKK